jgi:hypothetical protein
LLLAVSAALSGVLLAQWALAALVAFGRRLHSARDRDPDSIRSRSASR